MTTTDNLCQQERLIEKFSRFFNKENLLPVREAKLAAFITMVKALTNTLLPKFYLSALGTGYGKSSLILLFLKLWRQSGFRPDGSVLVCLPRLDQVERFATACGLNGQDYAVITSKQEYNELGRGYGQANDARVVFTTQAQVVERCKEYDHFADVGIFHYKNARRDCIIWDETLELDQAVMIPLDHLMAMPVAIRHAVPAVADALIAFQKSIEVVPSGEVVVPTALAKLLRDDLPWKVADKLLHSPQQREAVKMLAVMGGRTLTVQETFKGQMALVGRARSLPDDFAPAIIFDASGTVRHTYKAMEDHRDNLVRLPSGETDNSRLKIHLWHTPMGKEARSDPEHMDGVLGEVARLIRSQPADRWLCVHHKVDDEFKLDNAARSVNIPGRLTELVGDGEMLSFVNWGKHNGSNEFAKINNVIIFGVWRLPYAAYLASYIAATGLDSNHVDDDGVRAFIRGEILSHLLQAVGRSSIRTRNGSNREDVHVYLIADLNAPLIDGVQETFPGNALDYWKKDERPLTRQQQAAVDYLTMIFGQGVTQVEKSALRRHLDVSAPGLNQVIRDERMIKWFVENGIVMTNRRFLRMDTDVMPSKNAA